MPLAMSSATPEPADRVQGERGLGAPVSVSLVPLLAGAHGEGLLAHVGLDEAGMDRVDPDLVALAAELQRRRLGEQRDAALGQRIERIELRADQARDRRQVDDGGTMRALGAARLEMRQRARACPARRRSGSRPPACSIRRALASSTPLPLKMPALFTSTSSLPNFFDRGVHGVGPARLLRDVEMRRRAPAAAPRSPSRSCGRARRARRRSPPWRRRSPSSFAVAPPMPRAAPTRNATLPSSLFMPFLPSLVLTMPSSLCSTQGKSRRKQGGATGHAPRSG